MPPHETASIDPGTVVDMSPESSFERVYRGILRALYETRLVPGQRLVEPDLMRQFGVGRGTIREVLNRLSSANIVTLVRHKGAIIRMFSREEINQILDIVHALFGLAAFRAAERISTHGHAEQITTAYEQIRPFQWKNDFIGFVAARENFYRTVVQLSGNAELAKLFPGAQVHIMRLQLRPFDRAADSLLFEDYSDITAAIRSNAPQDAEQAARRHVRNTADSVASVPDRAFQSPE